MSSDSAQVADVKVGKFANIVDMSPKIKILIKHNTKISDSRKRTQHTISITVTTIHVSLPYNGIHVKTAHIPQWFHRDCLLT